MVLSEMDTEALEEKLLIKNNSNNNHDNSKWTVALDQVHKGLNFSSIGLEYLKKAFVTVTLNE